MLVYRNFRDIPQPLIINKSALTEKRAELFCAFPRREQLVFTASFHKALSVTSAVMRFRLDDNGSLLAFPMKLTENESGRDIFSVSIAASDLCGKEQSGLFYYHIVAETAYGTLYSHGNDASNQAWLTDDLGYANAYQLLIYQDDYQTPSYLKQGIMYQIFVDRFCRGGDAQPRKDVEMATAWDAEITQYPAYPGAPLKNNLFYGGDLDGVRLKLSYLQSLGVTVLYLCPIFEAYSNHKYDTGDYMQVDSMFGGREALDRLLADAKKMGIRVILDGVFNHTGAISRYFNMDGRYDEIGAYQSVESPYYPWYRFEHHPDSYACWWGVRILPSVDSANAEYRQFIAGKGGVVDTYLSAGVSGFRLDVADELNETLLCDLRSRVKGISRENALIGEVWEDASNKEAYGRRRHYFRGQELDSVMNYPLKNAIVHFLLKEDAQEFEKITSLTYAHYPRFVSEALMNLLGTHDTERILSVLGGQNIGGLSYAEMKDLRLTPEQRVLAVKRLQMAYAILISMPGIPCIYYGDEAGMEGAKDPFNRRTFPWGKEDTELLSFFRKMGKIRHSKADILTHGYYRVLYAQGAHLVFSRETDEKSLLVCVNAGDTTFQYPLEGAHRNLLQDVLAEGEVSVLPYGFCLLQKEKNNGSA